MTDEKRRYNKKARAELEEETRRRITESAVELHGSVGPAHTSVSAVAERAGVRRSTVYRHFPDEAALFEACSAHWSARNPPPDPTVWAGIADPQARLDAALGALYPYYRGAAAMLANLLRDEPTMKTVRDRFRPFHQYLAAIADGLLAGRGLRGRARTRTAAAIGHALAFSTWQSLAQTQGLGDDEAAALMAAMVASAA